MEKEKIAQCTLRLDTKYKNMRKNNKQESSPSFQFYASDWIADPNRLALSLEEQGAFILLFCYAWRGYKIEQNYETLSRMCNCRMEKIQKIYPKIAHNFEEVEENGKIYLICNDAEKERKHQEINREKRSKAGKLGAKIRWKDLK